jgi:ribonuclease P protein component
VLLILVAEQVSNSPESDQISATAEHLETTPARLGLVVAKKHLKRAVDRNRFKRLVRESFRSHQEQLAGLDVVVLARNGAIRSIRSQEQNVENTESVEELLTKAWRYIQRKRN